MFCSSSCKGPIDSTRLDHIGLQQRKNNFFFFFQNESSTHFIFSNNREDTETVLGLNILYLWMGLLQTKVEETTLERATVEIQTSKTQHSHFPITFF